MKHGFTAIIIVSAIVAAASWAEETTSWSLGGSVLAQPSITYTGAGSFRSNDFLYGSSTTLGLDLRARGDRARAEASLEAAVLTGAAARLAWSIAASPFGRPDDLLIPAAPPASPQPATLVALRARTLYSKLDFDWAALTVGRQVVNYGRGALWSPADIFTELDLTGLSPVRRGLDALRFVVPFGQTEAIDLVAAPTFSPADGRYALRVQGLLAGVDGALVTARDGTGKGWVFGADFKADLEIGFYGEATYELYDSGQTGTFKAAGGADYSFGDFILAAEYYYNGGGASSDPLFPGAHNLYGSIAWTPTQLIRASGTGIWDIGNGAGTVTLLITVSASQNATVGAYVQGSNGRAGYGLGYGLGSSTWIAQAGLTVEVKF